MDRKLCITIPWKHLASSNTRNKRRGGKGHSWGYKRSREAIGLIAMNAVPASERPWAAEGDVEVRLRFYPPDRRRRDVMNLCKALMDGCNKIAYDDDYQARRTTVERMDPDRDDPRCEMTVWSLNGQEGA